MKMKKLALFMSATLALQGCATDKSGVLNEAEVEHSKTEIKSVVNTPIVQNTGKAFVGSKLINRKQKDEESLPDGFTLPVTIGDGSILSLGSIGQRITAITRIPVNIDPDLIKSSSGTTGTTGTTTQPAPAATTATSTASTASTASSQLQMSVAHHGPLTELLDRIASRMGIAWEYRNGAINFSRYVTKVYSLNLMSVKSTQTSSVGKTGSSSTGAGAGAGTGGSGSSGAGGSFSSSSVSDFASTTDIWATVDSAVAALKTSGGKYSIGASAGMIVLTDTKDAHDRISRYISKLEKAMNRQVTLRVVVMSAENTTNDNSGIDWNLVWNRLNQIAPNYSLTIKGAPTAGSLVNAGGVGMNILAPLGGVASKWDGSSAMFKALNSVTKARMESNNLMTALNKQPVSLSIADQTGFVSSSMQQGVTGGNPIASTTVQMITTGFILNMTPSVADNDSIGLQFSLDLSSPPVITTFGQNQVPAYSGTGIGQITKLRNGETLILTGFSLKDMTTGKSGMFTPNDPALMGGSRTNKARDRDMVIMITATLE